MKFIWSYNPITGQRQHIEIDVDEQAADMFTHGFYGQPWVCDPVTGKRFIKPIAPDPQPTVIIGGTLNDEMLTLNEAIDVLMTPYRLFCEALLDRFVSPVFTRLTQWLESLTTRHTNIK